MLIASLSVPFSGCEDVKTAYALEEPKLIEVANEKKAEPTATQVPNSTVKGITVNEKGELVTTYANGVVQTIKGLAGEKGPKGEKGDKGDQGEPGRDGSDGRDGKDGLNGKDGIDGRDGADGRDGSDGSDGVGISSVSINDDGELIVTLTNGATSNAGNIVDMVSAKIKNEDPYTDDIYNSEIIGYKLRSFIDPEWSFSDSAVINGWTLTNNCNVLIKTIDVELIEHNQLSIDHRYKYRLMMTASAYWDYTNTEPFDHGLYKTNIDGCSVSNYGEIRLDKNKYIHLPLIRLTNSPELQTITYEFYSDIPYTSITIFNKNTIGNPFFVNETVL